jgi:hypothetical protein
MNCQKITDTAQAQAFLDDFNVRGEVVYNDVMKTLWTYNTNLTDYNQQKQVGGNFMLSFSC